MYSCRYQSLLSDPSSSDEQEFPDGSISDLNLPFTSPRIIVARSEGPIESTGDHLSVPGSFASVSSHPSSPYCSSNFNRDEEKLASTSQSPVTLDATELSLLSHYLSHTSQTIPFDHLDLYALSVGIPNLAFNNKPVMSSLLALAAACKSHDIVKQTKTPLDGQTLITVRELFKLAERHHRASLQHIQAAMSHSDWYDNVHANAALMVLYASASHSIRVYLAATAKRSGRQLPNEVLPQHSQWISFTRAAHTASTAILNDIVNATNKSRTASISQAVSTQDLPTMALSGTPDLSPQDGPSENTKRLFLPLVASTYSRALKSLRRRADSIAARFERPESSTCDQIELRACLETLPILGKCASAALSRRESGDVSEGPSNDPVLFDESSRVSPWVGKYMISVTSMKSPKALRRTILSFLNKVPSEYLNIIQSALDSPSAEASPENRIAGCSPKTESPSLDTTQLLAMDIFAHWLVLVMLLDGIVSPVG
ncbi:hypothetical protein N7510_004906 [Penicillium lagena]|uniref:uncharacterized protein n=1 Tax=Penicillium lagena TaxID=94218 RepID=UPI0025409F75|nr:uncharacterized protein N7510_004906 [Penicillium lagena]KAJ5620922.1 hypothetical protein N7510_004906 [Penicillium lagena]